MIGCDPNVARVALVDDHRPVREAIRELLAAERGLCVVGEAETTAEAVELVRSADPDVLLLDPALRDGLSLATIRAVLELRPDLPIVVVTMQDEPGLRAGSLAAGAAAFVLKDAMPAELLAATRTAADRGSAQPNRDKSPRSEMAPTRRRG